MPSVSPSIPNSCVKAPRSPTSTHPSRTIVGALDGRSTDAVLSLYSHLPGAKITTDIETAELVKYVDNTWHALKVAFTNEIAVVASTLGIDSDEVMSIFAEDNRLNISKAYMRPGFAFGGSCLPKDLRALAYLARTRDLSLPVISHILDSNRMLTRSRARLDFGALQEARCLSRNQLQARNGRCARKPLRGSRRAPERQGARRCASLIPMSISPICRARIGIT